MSDNKLLAENTVRRFMKLANVDTMTDNFLSEMYGKKKPKDLEEADTEEEITEEEEVELEENLEDLEEQEEDAPEGDDDEMEMDLGEPELDDEMGAADISLTEEEARLLISLGERLSAAMDEDEPEDEDELEMDTELDADAGDMDAPADDDPAKMYDSGTMEENQEELVNEVLRRVTRRLVAARRK